MWSQGLEQWLAASKVHHSLGNGEVCCQSCDCLDHKTSCHFLTNLETHAAYNDWHDQVPPC